MHHILEYHDLLPEEMLRNTSEEAGDNEETDES
jgi:hypothetical protein